MCDEGDALQARLAAHFARLHEARPRERALFALEHGLGDTDLEDVKRVVGSGSGIRAERLGHPLLWVVHATEVAYAYEGDEYWRSFAAATPGWDDRLRPWIRDTFREFARQYDGARPSGPWAEWFGIIAWPITHAVLPTDLQRHLARALDQSRAGLAARLGDTLELGRYIAATGGEGSDRYSQLRQQPALLGQIALALLQPARATDELLLGSTLRRLARDLERERSSRASLDRARRAVERTEVRLAPRHRVSRDHAPEIIEERVRLAAQATSPRIQLRPERSSPGSWAVWLALPDLTPIAAVDREIGDALRNSRCWVPASTTPVATGQLLRAQQELRLSSWPIPGSPLVRFQGMAAGLETALLREWAAPPLPALFGIGSDSRGVHIASRVVRAGRRYIVAQSEPLLPWSPRRVDTACTGVVLYEIALPDRTPAGLAEQLRTLGVNLIRTSRLWPAGFVPLAWDGEAAAEWLAEDTPILGIESDHELARLVLTLDDEITATSGRVGAGRAIFVMLPRIAPGLHRLAVREEPLAGPVAVRNLSITIREAPTATDGSGGPLRVWTEPYSSDLDDLWAARVAVCVGGPVGRIRMKLRLADRPQSPPRTVMDKDIDVPCGIAAWRALMSSATSDDEIAQSYNSARWGAVGLDAGPFGSYSLEFERSLPPIRWRVEDSAGRAFRLIDETGSALVPSVTVSSFHTPDRSEALDMERPGAPITATETGGLYVAHLDRWEAKLIAPPLFGRIRSFEQLRLDPWVRPVDGAASALSLSIQSDLWASSPLPGSPIARMWRSIVVRALHRQLVGWLCGPRWMDVEAEFAERPTPDALARATDALYSASPVTRRDAVDLAQAAVDMGAWPLEQRVEAVARLARHAYQHAARTWPQIVAVHGTSSREWAAELWLRLATDPSWATWAGASTQLGLEFAREWALPLRTARCLALNTLVGSTTRPSDFPPLFEGWAWR